MKKNNVLFICLVLMMVSLDAFAESRESNQRADENQIKTNTIDSCIGDEPSDSLKSSIAHLMGFTEIRDHHTIQLNSGLESCYSGLTLGKNEYQYYKNLVFIKYFDKNKSLTKQTSLLFQSSSIQGHHSPSGRPWVVLDSQSVNSLIIEELFEDSVNFDFQPLGLKPPVQNLIVDIPGLKSEVSTAFVFHKENFDYYIVSWLKAVTSANSGVYTSKVSPSYALLKLNVLTNKPEIIINSSAFYSILKPAEDSLKISAKEAFGSAPEEKLDYIEKLSEL